MTQTLFPWRRFTVPVPRLNRAARLFLIAAGTAAALLAVLLAAPKGAYIAAWDIVIVALLIAISQAFYGRGTYLFSSGFWTALFFTFYFVLKSIEYFEEENTRWVTPVLMHCAVFLCFYIAGYAATPARARSASGTGFEVVDSRRLVRACLLIFLLSRLFSYLAVMLVLGGEYNQLELVASTQNQGMAYIFRAFSIGQLAFTLLLIYGFLYRRRLGYVLFAVLVYLLDLVSSASRSGLIILILSVVFLYGRYVRRVSWIWLAVLALPLVFIVSFFGYVRDIELGSLGVYWEALQYFLDSSDIVWKLFVGRLDLLPAVAAALEAHAQGNLPSLSGSSYVDMFVHFIPRNLWPSKPPLTAAYVTVVVAPGPFEAGVLIYPTIFLEGFLNFGLAGIALAGGLVGTLAARYDRWLFDRSLARTFYFLVFFTFPLGLLSEGMHSNFVATALYSAVLAWILVSVLRRIGALTPAAGAAPRRYRADAPQAGDAGLRGQILGGTP